MLKNMKSVGVLVAICAAVALLLSLTNQLTAPIIEKNQAAAANGALLEVMPEGAGFELADLSAIAQITTVTEAYKETSGKGYVIKLTTTGYGPGAVCLSSNETLSKEKEYGKNFTGKDLTGVEGTDIIGGATMTTQAYKDAVKDAINAATILGGGSADLRSPEEILNDNLMAALPEADEFTKQVVVDSTYAIDYIYAANNGAGYVYVIEDKTFIGVDAEGNVAATDADDASIQLAKDKAALAAAQTKVDTTDSGIDANITAVQKTADGNYIMEVNGLGFAYNGDPDHYLDGKNIPIEICLVVSSDGTILNCLTVSQQESGGYGAPCGEETYYSQYVGKTEATLSEVDAIAGATITSSGYRSAVRKCLQAVIILEGGAQ